jgi:hypothetical protein
MKTLRHDQDDRWRCDTSVTPKILSVVTVGATTRQNREKKIEVYYDEVCRVAENVYLIGNVRR